MLKEKETIIEVDQFFDELETKPNWRAQRAYIYAMAYESEQQRVNEEAIEELVKSKYRKIVKTTIISDGMAIVEAEVKLNGNSETAFYPIANGKFHSESCMRFDEALVLALSRKYNQDRFAPPMIYNMLRMDLGNK